MPTRLNQLRTPLYHPGILPWWIQAEGDIEDKRRGESDSMAADA
jgi:hypothetical protein